MDYLKMLKRGEEPKPFSSTFPRIFIPIIHSTEYTKDEVVDAIESFRQEGLIKQIMPVFDDETRFQIRDDSLLGLIHLVWMINRIDMHLFIGKLAYGGKPTP